MPADQRHSFLPAIAADAAAFRDWSQRYEQAMGRSDDAIFTAIGREMGDWLDRRGLEGLLAGDGNVVFAVPSSPNDDERAFLDAPWELLSDKNGPLARRTKHPYRPARRIGVAKEPAKPPHSDLFVAFMAAAPTDQKELAFEAEEAGLRQATQDLDLLRLLVEESGALEPLEAPIEALHLSCHGDITDEGAFLAFEDDYGETRRVTIDDLTPALGDPSPGLVFLSACRTAEQSPGAATFAIELSGAVANVVGWDGSVYDSDAIAFAETFYRELTLGRSVPHAASSARRELLKLKDENPEEGRHWHLARVYLGPGGGGPLRQNGLPSRPPRPSLGTQVFLGGKEDAPVASPHVFVGRRRETQKVLRAFNEGKRAGVLLRGMGRLGKSSLAAHVGDRLPRHEVALVAPTVILEIHGFALA